MSDINSEDTECPVCTYPRQCHVCGGLIDGNETSVIDQDEDGIPVSIAHATCNPTYSH